MKLRFVTDDEAGGISLMADDTQRLLIGWAQADITPPHPVSVRGQFYARLSEKVNDPLTSTVLVVHDGSSTAVMVSCDLISISTWLEKAIRTRLKDRIRGIHSDLVCVFGTHTHTGPELDERAFQMFYDELPPVLQQKIDVMSTSDYIAFAADRIVSAVEQAWDNKRPGGISRGVTEAVVGHNRRWTSYDGVSTMYGQTDTPDFSHVEGWEDHHVRILCTWDEQKNMTGMIVNVPCPSQVSEREFYISADYWHETRVELRRVFGEDVYVLPQCAPAGDISPRRIVLQREKERVLRLKHETRRDEIARTITNAVAGIVPYIKKEIDWNGPVLHRVERVALTRRSITAEDVTSAMNAAEQCDREYDALLQRLLSGEGADDPRWYVSISRLARRARWYRAVQERFETRKDPYEVNIHVIRLGDVVFASNPFELYVDFGLQIQARSPAEQTFLIQLAGSGTYLTTERAAKAGGYGSVPSSNAVGPEGGRELVNHTVRFIESCF